jgi:hypothetical protein
VTTGTRNRGQRKCGEATGYPFFAKWPHRLIRVCAQRIRLRATHPAVGGKP